MSDSYKILLKSQGSVITRAGLYIVSGLLLQKGYISHDINSAQADQLVGFLFGAASLGWGLWEARRKHAETEVALSLPTGATREDLNRSLANK